MTLAEYCGLRDMTIPENLREEDNSSNRGIT
jgi:hypothetical protein